MGRQICGSVALRFIGFEREGEAISWAKEVLGITCPTGLCRAMSCVNKEGEFVFVVVMSNFTSRNVDMHTAATEGSSWATPGAIVAMFNGLFGYVFDTLNAKRVTGLVRKSNAGAVRFDEHLGFKAEGCMREAFPDGEDLLIYGFLKREYESHKWWRAK